MISQKVALVYDRVNTPHGGAEQVLLSLHELFPTAPLFTSVYHPGKAKWAKVFPQVIPSFLQTFPFAQSHHRYYLPLMPLAFESHDFSEFDIVISITSAEAKGILTGPKTLHICYLLTPTRYLWSHTHQYQKGIFAWAKSWQFSKMRSWDFCAGQRPDVIIPISEVVKKRCQKYYRRPTQPVIYPPFRMSNDEEIDDSNRSRKLDTPYFLVVSRLVEYKNVDLAIQACATLKQKLMIVGNGPDKKRLQQLIENLNAQQLIKIRSNVPPQELHNLYSKARALLLLAEEDFGIVALEAQYFGIPVIVNAKSGASEVVKDGKTGIHVSNLSINSICTAIDQALLHVWQRTVIKSHVTMYNDSLFKQRFSATVQSLWEKHIS